MMEELKTIDGELTTADLAKNGAPKQLDGPRLVNGRESEALGRAAAASESIPLFSESEMGKFRSQWIKIQTCFVDEPRGTVKDAAYSAFLCVSYVATSALLVPVHSTLAVA
jgi:hypothetical protein